ncbi:MAG: DUF2069 domain-containing protein [Betaproteobacteria bacterium]
MHPSPASRVAIAAVVALIALQLMWELVLAPIGGRGSWLALKALPLVALLPGTLRGTRRPRQWLTLLLPFYIAESLVRAIVEHGRNSAVAAVASAAGVAAFVALLVWLRREAPRHREHRPLDGSG